MFFAGCEEEPVVETTNALTENPQETCEILNANVDALHAIVEAMETSSYAISCTINGSERNVVFSNDRSVHFYVQPTSGVPFVNAKKDNGVYYWCIKNEWVLDDRGHKVEVLSNNPQFDIIDGYWFISFDGERFVNCGKVRGDECIKIFISVVINGKESIFNLINDASYRFKGYDEDDIRFEDSTVEEICVNNWDTNRDQRLSYTEAAAVTDIATKFQNKDITTFDELQYFTGLTTIGENAFSYCSGLTSITIPNSVTYINSYAFYNCSNLSSVYCKATTPPTLSGYAFDANDSTRKIYVPTASVNAYKSATYWSEYASAIVGYNF